MPDFIRITCLSFLCFLSMGLAAQEIIYIPEGSSPSIDGALSPGEWDGSDTIAIDLLDGREVLVWYKRDSVALYCVFAGPLGSFGGATPLFPEISFDMGNDRSASWDLNDWWFHVSANDCFARGNFEIYTNCEANPPLWGGAPNFGAGQLPDTVEVYVSFQKIGLDLSMTDTIGINFMVNNTSGVWRIWPDTAHRANPNTWAQAVFSNPSTAIDPEAGIERLEIYPNPGHQRLAISYEGTQGLKEISLYDVSLKPVKRHRLAYPATSFQHQFDLDLPSGIFLLRLELEQGEVWRKWVHN